MESTKGSEGMTTGSATFATTANIISVNPTDGKNGPQWWLKCKFPWTKETYEDSVYLDQSAFKDEPSRGTYRVEVAFRSLKNKLDGGKHSGTHYWMNNYHILKFVEQSGQMNTMPNNSSIWPGKEDEAARNSDSFSGNNGNTPAPSGNATANSNGGHYDPAAPYDLYRDRNYGMIRGHCENAVIAMMDKLPGLLDADGNPNWAMFVFYRDEFYNKVSAIDITVYAQDNEEPVAEPVTEEPAAPPAAPPAPPEHHCEVHEVDYNKYSTGYMHKVAGVEAWCHEGVDGVYDEAGNPVTDVLII